MIPEQKKECWLSQLFKRSSKMLFSCSVMSDSLRPHGLQHPRFLCLPLSPWVCSDSCSLCQWCHSTISSSVTPFFSCPQSFPASGKCGSALHIRWPKDWSFSLRISPSSEYSGLISLRKLGIQNRNSKKELGN